MPTFSTADGATLSYTDLGSGPAVVFLAGWGLPGASWQYQAVPLAEQGFRCVLLDRRGHGRSEEPGRGYDLDTLADDVGELMAQLDLRGAVLVGFSVGCSEAVHTATRHPERVKGLVLAGTTTPYVLQSEDSPNGIDQAMFEAFRAELLRDFPNWVEENAVPFAPAISEGMRGWIKSLTLSTSLFALVNLSRTQSSSDLRGELPRIGVPTLVIHGDRDETMPIDLTGRLTAASIPGARLQVYEGAPHGLIYTHADRFGRDLLRFLKE